MPGTPVGTGDTSVNKTKMVTKLHGDEGLKYYWASKTFL